MNLSKAWLSYSKGKWQLRIPNTMKVPQSAFIYMGSTPQRLSIEATHTSTPSFHTPVHVRQLNRNQLKVGPLIGILSVANNNRLLGNRANFIDIIKTGKQMGALVFVFTPKDVDWSLMLINGRFYDTARKKWIIQKIPFPDVVYNRIPNRDYEAEPYVIDTINRLQQVSNLHLFNPHFFDKWELFEHLQYTEASMYLPETVLLNDPQTLTHMLAKHKILYLKPTRGKAGSGIYRISHTNNAYVVHSAGINQKQLQFSQLDNLWQFISNILQVSPYILQQAIPLLDNNGAPFDVRVLAQKNKMGEWDVTGIGFRLAGKDGITTHVPQGGKIIYKETALYPHFGVQQSNQLLTTISGVTKLIASKLEERYQLLGEMSMDLGVTKDGDIWFFEANAKPMKFDEATIRPTSLRRIIEFSMYLSRFV